MNTCGCIIDYIRSCYRTRMRLWQGDAIGTRVQWQWCAPGAAVLPWASQMYSSVWDDETTRRTVGERRTNHSWYSGMAPVPLPGIHVCGPESAWRNGGVHGVTPEIIADQWGLSPCCSPTERAVGLSGGGVIRVSAVVHHTALCPLSGGGGISVSVQSSALVLLAVSGGGDIGMSLEPAYRVDTDLSGGGVLSLSGSTHTHATLSLSGGGSTGLVGTTHVSETCPLSGGGVITLSAEYHYHWDVTCPLSGGGEIDMEISGVTIIGEIRALAYDDVPSAWLQCDGATYLQSDYPELYAAIGGSWNPMAPAGHFSVPGLQRRSLVGDGGTRIDGPSTTIGSIGGEEQVLLTSAQSGLPAHAHGQTSQVSNIGGTQLVSAIVAATGSGTTPAGRDTEDTTAANAAVAHDTYHPVAVIRYMIYAGR